MTCKIFLILVQDYMEAGGGQQWNLPRDGRDDVKKPGPFFNSQNNFAFDYSDAKEGTQDYIPGENYWFPKMVRPRKVC